ncbi:MAG: hypothetical protein GC192_12400 [Bacteroidetes bacterium]|nr:hypothetical protein [Bacteroidota bacterium]
MGKKPKSDVEKFLYWGAMANFIGAFLFAIIVTVFGGIGGFIWFSMAWPGAIVFVIVGLVLLMFYAILRSK